MYNTIKNRRVKYQVTATGILPFFGFLAIISIIAIVLRIMLQN